MKRMKKSIRKILLTVVIVLAVVITGGSFFMLSYSLQPQKNKGRNVKESFAYTCQRYPEVKPWVDSLRRAHLLRDTFILINGERQHAVLAAASPRTGHTAILVHGYAVSYISMLPIARIYAMMGYNILLPDLHGHGQSNGRDVRMGWKDRFDVLRWSALADTLFHDSTGHTQQVLHGVSMGAATVMNVSGEKTPAYLRCFVEDCGYTSVWDEFHYELGNRFGLPSFPLMYTTSALCQLRYGWSFGEASSLKQVAKCHKPMLFIHGDNDHFVPTWMVRPLYAAKPQPKELYITHGSQHAQSYRDHRKEYVARIRTFVGRYIRK